ncbi:MAG: CAAX prenyl protease-related protein [Planctomycetota bacterium]|nr:CAAX prenyl protease-related protein [Planctomycetota bacterium]MDA1179864.1 CAAX prenyl protease-related protein [Planctomycetota bacterium]
MISENLTPDDESTSSPSEPSDLPAAPSKERVRGPRVFGKWAWTCWLPFLVYYCSIQSASYLDYVREHALVKGHAPGHEETHFGEFPEDKEEPQTYPEEANHWFPIHSSWYPQIYVIGIGLTLITMVMAIPGYRIPPFRISWLSIVLGILGIVIWIGLFVLDRDYIGLGAKFGGLGEREAFNPFEKLKDNPTWMYQFLAIRFLGLVFVVPIVEEFFLRAFLLRYLDDPDWDEIPLGVAITPIGFWGILAYGPLTHPAEFLAAAVWFGMVQWVYLRTKNVWDCVVIHAITNLLLGLYVLKYSAWELW